MYLQLIRSFLRKLTPRKAAPIGNLISSKNALFIHIPKNAGTSILFTLGIKKSHHYFYKDYVKILGEQKVKQLTTIAFSRNPWDRFISLYNYARMPTSYYHNNIDPSKGTYGAHADYHKLKASSLKECAILLAEDKLGPPHQWNIWLPQVTWLKDDSGSIQEPTFLGRLEHLHADFERLKVKLDIKATIPHINKSTKSCHRKLYDQETREIVDFYYKEDINYFNYEF